MNYTLDIDEKELAEIFSQIWFGMDLDFKAYSVSSESVRGDDAERFANVNGVRYSILIKLAGLARDLPEHERMKQVVEQASDIMVVIRGTCNGTSTTG